MLASVLSLQSVALARPPAPMFAGAVATAVTGLPTDRLHFGLANSPADLSWMKGSAVPWKYRYQYLSGGVNTGAGWETWNTPSGAFAGFYMSDSDSIGAIPVFTYYELLQSLPHTGSNESDMDYNNLNNATTMKAYYANFALLMTQAKAFGKTVVVHVEPDLFAYMEQRAAGGDASTVTASVANSGYSGLGALPNTFQGFAWALITLRDSIAPNVVLASHASTWAGGVDIGLNKDTSLNLAANADTVATFLNSAGIAANPTGGTFDAVFNDVADRDAGTPSSGNWWDRNDVILPDFKQWLTWMTELHAKTSRQLVVWQVPVGNQYFETMNQTPGHYQDNRAEYFLSHVSALEAAGIVAVLFGSGGNDNSTTYTDANGDGVTNSSPISTFECNLCNTHVSSSSDDDGGYLRIFVGQYYASANTAPSVTSVTPGSGPVAGGTAVTISGTNLGSATAVHFGSAAATILTDSASQITTTSPAASGTGSVDVTVTTAGGTSAATAADHFTYTSPAAYTAVTPVRLMDTRLAGGPLGPSASRNLTVAGVAGVPSTASAVVVNVTVTNTTAPSFLTVFPTGASRPLASNLNYLAGTTIPNLVSVQVGSGGAITFFNAAGSTDVVVDLEGYYAAPSGSAGGEVALAPARITDTRANSGQPNAGRTLGGGGSLDVQVSGAGGVPSSGVSAVILNVTVTNTTAPSWLVAWPAGLARPLASNLDWTAGLTIPNRVIVPLGSGGKISVFNSAGSADVIIDVSGYFTDSTATGKFFNAEAPIRLADTRITAQTLGPNGIFVLPVVGRAGVPVGATAVVLNVTVTNTTAPSWLVVYPSTGSRPLASDLDWVGGRTIPNLVVATLGSTGAITFFNSSGSTDVIVDIAGWYS